MRIPGSARMGAFESCHNSVSAPVGGLPFSPDQATGDGVTETSGAPRPGAGRVEARPPRLCGALGLAYPRHTSPPNSSALLERRRSRRCDRAAYKKVNIRLTNQKTLFATVSATLHAPLDAPLPNRADTTVRFVNPPRTVVAAHDRRKANRKTAEVTRRHQHLRSVRDREQLPSAHAAAGQMTIYPAQAPLPPPAMEASVAEARAQGRCRRAR